MYDFFKGGHVVFKNYVLTCTVSSVVCMQFTEFSFSHVLLFGDVHAKSENLLLTCLRQAIQAGGAVLNFRLRDQEASLSLRQAIQTDGTEINFRLRDQEAYLRHANSKMLPAACPGSFSQPPASQSTRCAAARKKSPLFRGLLVITHVLAHVLAASLSCAV